MLMMTNVILHKGVSSFVSVYFSDITSHLFSWLVKNLFTFVCCFITGCFSSIDGSLFLAITLMISHLQPHSFRWKFLHDPIDDSKPKKIIYVHL